MIKNFIPELKLRGLLQDITPGLEEQLDKEMTVGYCGFDPTADSLHIGSMLPIILLMHMQRAGHKPIILIGGATGMIGDPTGKSAERNLLDENTIQHNIQGIKKQLEKFLIFDETIPNSAEIVNNYDWLKNVTFLNFIRDVGKHITVNYMLAKESVQKRMAYGLSFTEFTYQLIQGYDFYYLNKHNQVKLQFGGADQWGNITTGTELIRKMGGTEAFAFTCPLLKKSDGGKFGKTEGGNVWLDPEKTSPFHFYQYWLNISDEDAKSLIKIFTFIPINEIDDMIAQHDLQPHMRYLQNRLAEEITILTHSKEDLEFAKKATNILFGKATKENLSQLSPKQFIQIMEGVPQFEIQMSELKSGIDILDVLIMGKILPSKSEARKMIQSGAISINKEKILPDYEKIKTDAIIADKYILFQKGKKNYYLATII